MAAIKSRRPAVFSPPGTRLMPIPGPEAESTMYTYEEREESSGKRREQREESSEKRAARREQ